MIYKLKNYKNAPGNEHRTYFGNTLFKASTFE